MVYVAPFIVLPLIVLWVHAERRWGMPARLGIGIALIVVCSLITHSYAMFIPRYERTFHRSSLRLAGELTAKGETQRVQDAIETYNGIASTDTTYRASMEMWHILNHGTR